MRLATFHTGDNRPRPGVVVGDEVADLGAAAAAPPSLLALLSEPDWPARVESLMPRIPRRPLASVKLAAPLVNPPKYMAIGLNTRDHRREITPRFLMREPRLISLAAGYLLAHPRPQYPYFFAKAVSAITGPYDPIVLPPNVAKVDWEGELAVVIGAHVHEADVAAATAAIAGYTIANDISVRDWQLDNPTSAALAKSYPTHGPLGPWLVTADELDTPRLRLRTYLNTELRQQGDIGELILSPAEIVSRLSTFCLLEPGDVIACGTFAGTGWPVARFLRPGDTVRVEIDGIGHIENLVIAHRQIHGRVGARAAQPR